MPFDPVVFGIFVIGTGFTDADSISAGGLTLYIHILADTGTEPSGVTVTYIDQNGNPAEPAAVSTGIPAYSTAGTYIQVILNGGDSGVQDVTSVSVIGGTSGDTFELTSLNEGLGKILPLAGKGHDVIWNDPEPKKEDSLSVRLYDNEADLGNAILTGLINSATPPAMDYKLETEVITIDCMTEVKNFGFLSDNCIILQNGDMLSAEVGVATLAPIDAHEPAARFKWFWNGGAYEDKGFFKTEFYYAVRPGAMHIFEFLDKDLAVKLSTTSNVGGWVRPALHSACGGDLLHPASKAVDGNTSTYWQHGEVEQHWIILDLGASKGIDAVRIYTAVGIDPVDIYISDDPAYFGDKVVADYPMGLPDWNKINLDFIIGRYVKIVFKSPELGTISDVGEIEVFCLEKVNLNFVSTGWEARLRVKSSGTTAGDEFLKIYAVKIERFKLIGTAETLFVDEHPNLTRYGRIIHTSVLPAGTATKLQLAFSDNNITWSGFVGPDGTTATFYEKPAFITVPAGYTGYYFKWKVTLTSDGRYTPTYSNHMIYLWEKHPGIVIDLLKRLPGHITTETQSMMPITLLKGCPRATDGYPAPACAGGSYLTFDEVGLPDKTGKTYSMILACPRATEGYPVPACSGGSFLVFDAVGDRMEHIAKTFLLASSWLESVVGQVVSGYCKDQDENIIIGAVKVVLTSSTTDGMDVLGSVVPGTGLYQLFVKNVKYDGRDLIVTIEGKPYNMSYSKYGEPEMVDGTAQISSPLDLHFRKPASVCKKCVAHVDSLVTY
ncbi:MAG: discoidin domain-containing protein [Candidatus Methanoperedens sp.]|nr:discoidin domain-containing protein [Candidatus Methanoperedens sp.]